uniref:Candidate secreted effector n=1 Tax=Meloidogyne incognita TaxID=6306 RepID=A0A914LF42_MELIC
MYFFICWFFETFVFIINMVGFHIRKAGMNNLKNLVFSMPNSCKLIKSKFALRVKLKRNCVLCPSAGLIGAHT